jgi:hypothetical protein
MGFLLSDYYPFRRFIDIIITGLCQELVLGRLTPEPSDQAFAGVAHPLLALVHVVGNRI